jgi:hypothetical protein
LVNFAAQNGDVLDDLLLADRVEKPAGNVGDILVLKTKSNIPMVSMPSGRSAQREMPLPEDAIRAIFTQL